MVRSFEFITDSGYPQDIIVTIPGLDSGKGFQVRPRYVAPRSRPAKVAALVQAERLLVDQCGATPVGSCGAVHVLPDPERVVPGYDPRKAIEQLRSVVHPDDARLAVWAYFDAGCPRSSLDAELARVALREPIEPLAQNVWPVGIARAIVAADGPTAALERVRLLRDEASREIAAGVMIELINEARGRGDLQRAADLRRRLTHGEGPWTGSLLVTQLLAVRSVVGAKVGSISLHTLDGRVLDVATLLGAPVLLYTAASWCAACHRDGLPELREVAAQYPQLNVVYVLWDDAAAAAAYVDEHAPIPGTVVVPDEHARARLEVLLGAPAFPSYVVVDESGRVVALPDTEDLATVLQRSGVVESATPPATRPRSPR